MIAAAWNPFVNAAERRYASVERPTASGTHRDRQKGPDTRDVVVDRGGDTGVLITSGGKDGRCERGSRERYAESEQRHGWEHVDPVPRADTASHE